MKDKKLSEMMEENSGSISYRTLHVLYNILISKVIDPTLDDVKKYYNLINTKTKQMKKTNKEIQKIIKNI